MPITTSHRRSVRSLLTSLVAGAAAALAVVVGGVVLAAPAHAAGQGAGFGTWAPISTYGWHGSMLVDGVHTYCITPGAPAPTGASTDHGVSGAAAGLSPQQLTGINLLVTTYGQTDDPVQAAAVGWAVKAIAHWDETLHAFGYRGDSLAGAIHWTFSALAPEHSRAVQERAVSYYEEATRAGGSAETPTGSLVFTTDAADHRSGSVRVDASTASATGTITLTDAVFADTGSPTREGVTPGPEYPIIATPPAEGRPYSVSGSGRFSAGFTAAVRHYTTPGGQDTAGPAGALEFDVAGADTSPRVPPFAPAITTQVAARYATGGPYIDEVTFGPTDGSWPRAEDGSYLPVSAGATVYRTDREPAPGDALPTDAEQAGALEVTTDAGTGPTASYTVTSSWEMAKPGFYTAVWTVRGADQSDAVSRHSGADYVWTEQFGTRSQVAVVPAISTTAQPVAAAGETLSDTINVTGGVPSDGLRITSALYRAVDSVPAGDTCVPENLIWESAPVEVPAAGTYSVTSPVVDTAGTYYWQERALDSTGDLVHVGICGIENETSRVVEVTVPPAPSEQPPALAATGASFDSVRTPAAVAVGLLTAGISFAVTRRPRFGARPKIG